jgi:hypothetical protein
MRRSLAWQLCKAASLVQRRVCMALHRLVVTQLLHTAYLCSTGFEYFYLQVPQHAEQSHR